MRKDNHNVTDWKALFDRHGDKLIFTFSSQEAANHFKSWLCEMGEQQYWDWMTYREQEEEVGDITALEFDYHTGTDEVPALCGRLDGQDG